MKEGSYVEVEYDISILGDDIVVATSGDNGPAVFVVGQRMVWMCVNDTLIIIIIMKFTAVSLLYCGLVIGSTFFRRRCCWNDGRRAEDDRCPSRRRIRR